MLDFNIYRDTDRAQAIIKEIDSAKRSPTQKQLELYANYILFGKDAHDQNAVDRGEVEIETKYNTYKRKRAGSLDELMESPTFNETEVRPIKRSPYTNPKPKIDTSLPQYQGILQEVQKIEKELAELKESPNSETKATKTKIYNLEHLRIALLTEQYVIQEASSNPVRCFNLLPTFHGEVVDSLGVNVLPMGLKVGNLLRFTNPKEDPVSYNFPTPDPAFPTIDFENPSHIYQIIEFYEDLYEKGIQNPYTNTKYLCETLDFYIDNTYLKDSRRDILIMKKWRFTNSQINKYLAEHYGFSYSDNYISTIYTKEICKKIAETATLIKDEWDLRDDPSVWKRCNCCGKWKLKDPREFIRKKNSSDGYTSRCKDCDRKKKEQKSQLESSK